MTIGEYKKFLNSIPDTFDGYPITHREYINIEGENLNAEVVDVYSIHIDENTKQACNMSKESYELYNEFVKRNLEKKENNDG